jgi:hypothetical protein
MPHKDPLVRKEFAEKYRSDHAEEHRVYMTQYRATPTGRTAKRRYETSSKAEQTRRAYKLTLAYVVSVSRTNAKKGKYLPVDPATIRPPRKSGHCDFCEKHRKLCLDHDHLTGRFRGWLCSPCNTAFGVFGDTVEGLLRGIDYVNGTHKNSLADNAATTASDEQARIA